MLGFLGVVVCVRKKRNGCEVLTSLKLTDLLKHCRLWAAGQPRDLCVKTIHFKVSRHKRYSTNATQQEEIFWHSKHEFCKGICPLRGHVSPAEGTFQNFVHLLLTQPGVTLKQKIGFSFQTAIFIAVNGNDHIQNP